MIFRKGGELLMGDINKAVNYLNHLSNLFLGPETYSIYSETLNGIMSHIVMVRDNEPSPISGYLTSAYDICRKEYTNKFQLDRTGGLMYCALYAWIQSKIVYSFDPDVEDSFNNMNWWDISGQPVDILSHLPVNSFSIKLGKPLELKDEPNFDTILVFNDYKLDSKGRSYGSAGITFILLNSDTPVGRKGYQHPVRLIGFINIEPTEGFPLTFQSMYDANVAENLTCGLSPDEYQYMLTHLLPYVLYLCSQNAEISQPQENKLVYRPYNGTPKHKYREVKQLICGEPTGIRIRDFKRIQRERRDSGEGSMKSPHIRRAHYHRYWVGVGNDRHVELRWIAPICVHKELNGYIKPTNAQVRQEYS